MPTQIRVLLISMFTLLAGGWAAFLIAANPHPEVKATPALAPNEVPDEIVELKNAANRPLASYQIELIEIAFRSASAFPLDPHIKNRSRAQETVVTTCLELDQPVRALGQIQEIADWRRGAGYADLAFYLARHGDTQDVPNLLDLAGKIADGIQGENAQDWQQDRIRVKIARTHVLLGQNEQAARLEQGVEESESCKVNAVRAMVLEPEEFEQRVRELDAVIATGSFDPMRNAFEAFARLHDRVYENAERRKRVEEKVKASWGKLPAQVQVETMMQFVEAALDHQDRTEALRLVEETEAVLHGVPWGPEDGIPLEARLAALRFRAGDEAAAREELKKALHSFETGKKDIVDIYRAQILRPIAEAHATFGEPDAAREIFRRAAEEGLHNPNSRPRANDLTDTCCSMARHEIDPGAELMDRLRHISVGLGDPW